MMEALFIGKNTLVCDAYGIKSQKQFINTLYDNIKTRGPMDTMITDGGKYIISMKFADLHGSIFINSMNQNLIISIKIKRAMLWG